MMHQKTRTILFYLLIFLPALFLFSFIGKIIISFEFVISLVLMIIGLGSVYFAFEAKSKEYIFFGGTVFQSGVILYLLERYPLMDFFDIVVPSIPFIAGFNVLLFFINEPSKRKYLYISIALLAMPLAYMLFEGRLQPLPLFENLLYVAGQMWFLLVVVLISLMVIIFLER